MDSEGDTGMHGKRRRLGEKELKKFSAPHVPSRGHVSAQLQSPKVHRRLAATLRPSDQRPNTWAVYAKSIHLPSHAKTEHSTHSR